MRYDTKSAHRSLNILSCDPRIIQNPLALRTDPERNASTIIARGGRVQLKQQPPRVGFTAIVSCVDRRKRSGRPAATGTGRVTASKGARSPLTRFRVKATKGGSFLRARMFSRSSITRTTSGAVFCKSSRGGASPSMSPRLRLVLANSEALPEARPIGRGPGRSPGRISPAGKRAIYPRQPHSPTRTPRPHSQSTILTHVTVPRINTLDAHALVLLLLPSFLPSSLPYFFPSPLHSQKARKRGPREDESKNRFSAILAHSHERERTCLAGGFLLFYFILGIVTSCHFP